MSREHQPTWDFLSGDHVSPPPKPREQQFRETLKQSTVARADANNENLRAQLNTLQYELDSLKQERELSTLNHQQEVRDANNRAETDFKARQTAENEAAAARKKAEAASHELVDVQDRTTNEKLQLEKKIRNLQDDNRSLREDLEDAQSKLQGQERQNKHAQGELEQKYTTLQASVEGIQQDLEAKVNALQTTQQKLAQKETQAGDLENEVLRLKAQTGDSDTLAVIKKEL
ncbi:hypothetical protein KC334_g19803, partial [Hortaea werneckii]